MILTEVGNAVQQMVGYEKKLQGLQVENNTTPALKSKRSGKNK